MRPSDEIRPAATTLFQWMGLVPVVITILVFVGGGLVGFGYLVQSIVALNSSQIALTKTVTDGFEKTNRTLEAFPLQTRQLADVEKRGLDTVLRLEQAVANGAAARERLAGQVAQRDNDQDRVITELRQAFAVDHAMLVRMEAILNGLADAANGRMPSVRR